MKGLKVSKKTKIIEAELIETKQEEKVVEAVAIVKVGLTNDYVARTYKIKGDKVISVEDTEQNDKRIAFDLAKIKFIKSFESN